jgi:Protein of unknown function (DUF1697)
MSQRLASTCLTLSICALFAAALQAQQQTERKLAPDALNIIKSSVEFGETFQGPVDLPLATEHPELSWDPAFAPKSDTLLEMAKNVTFRGPVYGLEFAFKPVRTIEMDVETANGTERKLVWYLLYRVTYRGNDYQPAVEKDQFDNPVFGKPDTVSSKWVRFMPNFWLQSRGLKSTVAEYRALDRVVPAAVARIAAAERVPVLNDSLTIQRQKIELGQSLWGVATWIDVDPNMDFFTIEVKGLTNAQKIELDGTKLKYTHKTLLLNFFRPGDTIDTGLDKIQYGVPAVDRLAGLRDELTKVLANRDVKNKEPVFDYELNVVGGLEGRGNVNQEIMKIAEAVQQLGGEQIRTYSQSGSVLFSLKNGGNKETFIENNIQRTLGLKVDVVDRATRLSEVIELAEKAKDESRQAYILQQYGLKERLDHLWVYR